jgi:aspartyl-tRNA(Asn)/glutamyl-tRNA(Gln) amidotransferase subunit C
VEHIAALAGMDLSLPEAESLREDMNRILGFFETLSDVETEGAEPAFSVLAGRDVFRADEPADMLTNEEALANAPDRHEGCFRVPAFMPED